MKVKEIIFQLQNSMIIDLYRQYRTDIRGAHKKYKQLKKKWGENCHFFLVLYNGTGDVYFSCIYLESYAKNCGITQLCLLVIGENCKNVGRLFPEIPIESITQAECNNLARYGCLTKNHYIHYLHYDAPIFRNGVMVNKYLRGYKDINFLDMMWIPSFGDVTKLTGRQPVFDNSKALAFCHKHSLISNNTVILSPYAKSVITLLPTIFWERVAALLQKNGMLVVTNCAASENEIAGTKRLCFDYTISVPVMNYCGYYVGIRSGLTDIISKSTCKKIVFYPEKEKRGCGDSLSYFSLAKLALDDTALELEYPEDQVINDETICEKLADHVTKEIIKMRKSYGY